MRLGVPGVLVLIAAACSVDPLPGEPGAAGAGGAGGFVESGGGPGAGRGGESGSDASAGAGGSAGSGGSGAAAGGAAGSVDAGSSGGSSGMDASAGSSGSGAAGSAAGGAAGADAATPPVCGNGKREDMPCDGQDLGGASCASLFGPTASGTLTCSAYCQFVTTDCSPEGAFGDMSALQAGAPWPMYRHDPHLTGRSPLGTASSLSVKWTLPLWVAWGMVVDKNGVVYFGSGNSVRAIRSDSSEKWRYDTPDGVGSIPLIRADGSVVFAANDGYVYAVDSDGARLWATQVAAGAWALRVAIGPDGTLYATTDLGQIVALTSEGVIKWRYTYGPAGEWVGGNTPAIAADGTIYVSPSWSNAGVTALTPEGVRKWIYAEPGADGTLHSGIDASGALLVHWKSPAPDARIVALAPDKTEKWSAKLPLPATGAAIGSDGTLYFGWVVWFAPGTVAAWPAYAASARWTAPGDVPNGASPVIGSDGLVIATLAGATGVQRLSPVDGARLGFENLPGPAINVSAIAIAGGGRIYVGSRDGLHALGP
jgi:sugar lactone lactonase YvrE